MKDFIAIGVLLVAGSILATQSLWAFLGGCLAALAGIALGTKSRES